MDKKDVIDFFDGLAKHWDDNMIRSDEIINIILDNAQVGEGKTVLDTACGTGVLIPDYIKRNIKKVIGIDISSKMIEIAQNKFKNNDNASFICGDVEETAFDEKFDCIVVYNAFPHFPDPERLIKKLSSMLKKGGTLTVAHGMSREKIDNHHSGAANKVSNGLMSEDELAEIFGRYLTVTVKISDDNMYQVAGINDLTDV